MAIAAAEPVRSLTPDAQIDVAGFREAWASMRDTQFDLMDALQQFARERGHALVAVLHDINQALAGFDRLWLLSRGSLIADLPSDRAAIGPLEQLYGIGLHCIEDDAGGLAVVQVRHAARAGVHRETT